MDLPEPVLPTKARLAPRGDGEIDASQGYSSRLPCRAGRRGAHPEARRPARKAEVPTQRRRRGRPLAGAGLRRRGTGRRVGFGYPAGDSLGADSRAIGSRPEGEGKGRAISGRPSAATAAIRFEPAPESSPSG